MYVLCVWRAVSSRRNSLKVASDPHNEQIFGMLADHVKLKGLMVFFHQTRR